MIRTNAVNCEQSSPKGFVWLSADDLMSSASPFPGMIQPLEMAEARRAETPAGSQCIRPQRLLIDRQGWNSQ
jgi:hypothetical protein